VNDLAREVGCVFGIAVLGSILNSGYRDDVADATAQLPAPAADAAQGSIAAASEIARRAGPAGIPLLDQAERAFVNGMSSALLVGAVVLFAAAGLVALLGPRRAPAEARRKSPVSADPGRRWRVEDGRQ
jgi:hypothetical protein